MSLRIALLCAVLPRAASELPSSTKFSTESEEPNRARPHTDTELPSLAMAREDCMA